MSLTTVLMALAVMAAAASAHAQVANEYLFASDNYLTNVGIRNTAWQGGAGVELGRGDAGVTGEVAVTYFPAVSRVTATSGAFAKAGSVLTLSADGISYFARSSTGDRGRRFFAAAGLTVLVDGPETHPMLNVGIGLDWWRSQRVAYRVEVREHLAGARIPVPVMLSFRAGVVFPLSR